MANITTDELKEMRAKSAEWRKKRQMSFTLSAEDFNSVICAQKRDKKGTQKKGKGT